MKRLILFPFLFITIIPVAQKNDKSEPPKKSSKIIVLAKDSANTLLDRISGALFDLGYTTDVKDIQAKYIITKPRPSKHYGTMSIIKARVNDTAIVLSSQIAINSDRDIFGGKEAAKSFYDVDYSGSKKSAMREAWNEMGEIARKFGDQVIYSK